ncbi:uncharacterized protein PG998_011382 [Apiospora kogelbergensis]|uniref:Uncharacterized protein n=1 Tax=Apiospora kogelbergensis TaxID=1337665 RepID=A0AAW0RBQ8_9PEZI
MSVLHHHLHRFLLAYRKSSRAPPNILQSTVARGSRARLGNGSVAAFFTSDALWMSGTPMTTDETVMAAISVGSNQLDSEVVAYDSHVVAAAATSPVVTAEMTSVVMLPLTTIEGVARMAVAVDAFILVATNNALMKEILISLGVFVQMARVSSGAMIWRYTSNQGTMPGKSESFGHNSSPIRPPVPSQTPGLPSPLAPVARAMVPAVVNPEGHATPGESNQGPSDSRWPASSPLAAGVAPKEVYLGDGTIVRAAKHGSDLRNWIDSSGRGTGGIGGEGGHTILTDLEPEWSWGSCPPADDRLAWAERPTDEISEDGAET